MFPSPNNPSADASMRLSDEQPSANHMPHAMMMLSEAIDISENNQYQQQYRNDWGDTNGQVDYFASSGFNNDSIYNESWSISPLTRSRPANYVTQQRSTYPTQDLNPHYEGLQLSSSSPSGMSIDGGSAPELVPLPPPLPPVEAPTQSQSGKFRANEVASMATSSYPRNNNEVDPFELGASTVAAPSHPPTFVTKTPDGEWRGDDYNKKNNVTGGGPTTKVVASRVSTSPSPKVAARAATTKPTRKKKTTTKGVSSSSSKRSPAGGGIKTPSKADILRGRGGLTNRHPGNMKFRDEARKLRGNYRNKDCTRQEKFILSQQLANRVKEYGGRFLEKKKGSDLWFEMSDKDARKKCSQGKREILCCS